MCWPAAMDPAATLLLTVGAAVVLGVRGHNAPRIIPPCVPGQTVVQAARTTAALAMGAPELKLVPVHAVFCCC